MPRLPVLALPIALLFGLAACNADDAPGDGGADDGGTTMCGVPDTACPADAPLAGAPCEGALSCEYIHPDSGATEPDWEFACTSGAWELVRLDCLGCAPPLVERCSDPFEGTLDGASFELGPVSEVAFAPFAPGVHTAPVFGGQGLAMIEFRVRVDPLTAPGCMTFRIQASMEGVDGDLQTLPAKLRCGETLRMYAILPSNPCEFREYLSQLTVEIEGIGSETVDLVLDGGSCPRTL
jgi:hypothetical protein